MDGGEGRDPGPARRSLSPAARVEEARREAQGARRARWRRLRRVATVLVVLAPLVGIAIDAALSRALAVERERDVQLDLWLRFHSAPVGQPMEERGNDPWGMPWLTTAEEGMTDWWEAYSSGPNRLDEDGVGDDISIAYMSVPRERASVQRSGRSMCFAWVLLACGTALALAAPRPRARRFQEVLIAAPVGLLLGLLTGAVALELVAGLRLKSALPWIGPDVTFGSAVAGVLLGALVLRLGLDPASDEEPPSALERRSVGRAALAAGAILCVVWLVGLGTGGLPPAPVARKAPISDDEVRAFARRVEKSIARGDASYVDGRLDPKGFMRRALGGRRPDRITRARFRELGLSVGEQILATTGPDGGSLRLLRVGPEGDRRTALFRALGPGGQINHFELTLARMGEGDLVYDDVRAVMGVRASDELRKLSSTDPADRAEYEDARRMAALVRRDEYLDAVRLHAALPAARRDRPALLRLRLAAALALGGAEYERALEAVQASGTEDPGLRFVLLRLHELREDWPACVATVAELDAAIGGDPQLEAMQASALARGGDLAGARARARSAAERDRTLSLPLAVLLRASLADRDHAATLDLLGRLEALGVQFGDLRTNREFAAFVESAEYASWSRPGD